MTEVYRTLRVAPSGTGVLGVVIDSPPMNLIGPELVRDLVNLFGVLESGQETFPADAVRSAKRVLNELTLPGDREATSRR